MVIRSIETIFNRVSKLALVLAVAGGGWMGFASVPDTAAQVAFVRPLTASSSRSDTSPQSAASSLRSYNGRQPAASQFDKVLAVQRLLIANGFGIDGVDGVLEEIAGVLTVETANAIRSFQRQNNLKVDGQVSVSLLTFLALHAVDRMADGDRRDINQASEDEEIDTDARSNVAFVQRLLARSGFEPGRIDGILVPATEQAILDFETHTRLDLTGKITPDLIIDLDFFEEAFSFLKCVVNDDIFVDYPGECPPDRRGPDR